MNEFLYRVVSLEDWEEAQGLGRVPRCGSDDRDGFVHLSTEETFIETANLYFEISEAPLALEIDPKLLGDDLKWERRGLPWGRSFSSLYSEGIPLSAVRAVISLDHSTQNGFTRGLKRELSGWSSGAVLRSNETTKAETPRACYVSN